MPIAARTVDLCSSYVAHHHEICSMDYGRRLQLRRQLHAAPVVDFCSTATKAHATSRGCLAESTTLASSNVTASSINYGGWQHHNDNLQLWPPFNSSRRLEHLTVVMNQCHARSMMVPMQRVRGGGRMRSHGGGGSPRSS
jgi:hypothetical protein